MSSVFCRGAGAIACAIYFGFSGTSFAQQGWYVGVGAGYDHMGDFKEGVPGGTLSIPTDDTALIVGSFGYRFANRVRLEAEVSRDRHDVAGLYNGNVTATSEVVNIGWDIPLSTRWDLVFGAGAGLAEFSYCTGLGAAPCTGEARNVFIGQIFAEVSTPIALIGPNAFLYAQLRERLFATTPQVTSEQAGMLGIRWYFETPSPPLPPP